MRQDIVWFRYIDDVLCFWPSNLEIGRFLLQLNDLVPSINFTHELEFACKIPFLDVLIHRDNDILNYSIFRKPSAYNSYIHYFSGHTDSIKRSVFISMFLRALRIVSPCYFAEEINKIRNVAKDLKYPDNFIQICYEKARRIFYRTVVPDSFKLENILVLPFNKNFMKVKNLLKAFNINVVFSFNGTLKSLLIKNSPCNKNCCIYRVDCKDCNKFYVGQTAKSLGVRVNQHKYSVRSAQETNAIFCHLRDENHQIDWVNSSEILFIDDFYARNILESIIIKKTFTENMNLSQGLYNIDPLAEKCIIRFYNLDRKFEIDNN